MGFLFLNNAQKRIDEVNVECGFGGAVAQYCVLWCCY